MFYYKESTLFFGFYSGFTRGEYHVIRVDFIVALRRTKGRGRRTLRSPPSPSSGLHLIHPGYPLRRGILAAAVDRDLVSLYPVQIFNPHFDVSFGCLVFGLGLFAFQWISLGLYRTFFVGGGWTVHSCGYVAFCYGLSLGLPLTAPFLPISLNASPFHQLCRVKESCKTRSCSRNFKKTGIPYSLSY